ncbi:MAG: methyl-accepting chemotaxis protein [Microcoleaceae cyanobacterium]
MTPSVDFLQEYEQTEKAYTDGDYERAAALVYQLVEDYPENPNARLLCGHIYGYGLQQYDVAREQYLAVLDLTNDPELVDQANMAVEATEQFLNSDIPSAIPETTSELPAESTDADDLDEALDTILELGDEYDSGNGAMPDLAVQQEAELNDLLDDLPESDLTDQELLELSLSDSPELSTNEVNTTRPGSEGDLDLEELELGSLEIETGAEADSSLEDLGDLGIGDLEVGDLSSADLSNVAQEPEDTAVANPFGSPVEDLAIDEDDFGLSLDSGLAGEDLSHSDAGQSVGQEEELFEESFDAADLYEDDVQTRLEFTDASLETPTDDLDADQLFEELNLSGDLIAPETESIPHTLPDDISAPELLDESPAMSPFEMEQENIAEPTVELEVAQIPLADNFESGSDFSSDLSLEMTESLHPASDDTATMGESVDEEIENEELGDIFAALEESTDFTKQSQSYAESSDYTNGTNGKAAAVEPELAFDPPDLEDMPEPTDYPEVEAETLITESHQTSHTGDHNSNDVQDVFSLDDADLQADTQEMSSPRPALNAFSQSLDLVEDSDFSAELDFMPQSDGAETVEVNEQSDFLDDFEEFEDLENLNSFEFDGEGTGPLISDDTSGFDDEDIELDSAFVAATSSIGKDSSAISNDELFSPIADGEAVSSFTMSGEGPVETVLTTEQGPFAAFLENASLKTKFFYTALGTGVTSLFLVAATFFVFAQMTARTQDRDTFYQVRNTGVAMTLMAGAAGFLTTWGLGSLASRQVRRSTDNLQEQFDAVTHNNFKARATVYATDEFGQMAAKFNNMAQFIETTTYEAQRKAEEQEEAKENLQRQVIRLLDDVEGAARGDLTVTAEVTADVLGAVADSFNLTIQNLREIVMQVKQAARQVSRGATDSSTFAKDVASDALRQAEELAATLNSVQVLTDAIQRVADSAREAEEVARSAAAVATRGGESVQMTVAGILKIRETVAETTREVKRLAESSQEISKIVAIISGIASRTNLLALNASIEAARAGEAGRGFAIVADEVRQLADRSAKSLKEIEQIVMQIQSQTSSVMMAMEEGNQQVIEGTRLAEQAKRSLDDIIQVTNRIDVLVRSITADTVEQNETARAVAQVMQTVEHSAQETSQEAHRVSSALSNLVGVARDLLTSVERFRVDSTERK